MSYRFGPQHSVKDAVPRIAREVAKRARDGLAQPGPTTQRIHDARTSVKRLRGLLRLVEPARKSHHEREDHKLAKISGRLAPLRDAEVLLQTLERIARSRQGELRKVTAKVRRALKVKLGGVGNDAVELALQEASSDFRKFRRRARALVPRHGSRDGGWSAIATGLEEGYRNARKGRERAYRPRRNAADGAERFHDWRKSVKYHGYHLRLLRRVLPGFIEERLRVNDELGDLLGEDHDLAVLVETLSELPTGIDPGESKRLLRAIGARQRTLRSRARVLGDALYAETPAVFTKRIRAAWYEWHPAAAR